jgi:hypothetical protein
LCLNYSIIKTFFKHIISILLVTTILLPFAVQFVHSFEKHEHSVCHSQNKTHFDSHEIDCSVFHFKINNNTISFSSIVFSPVVSFREGIIISVKHQFLSETPQHKSSRAPPYLLV